MKTKMLVIVGFVSVLFLFTGCAEMAYKKASQTNSIKVYEQFVIEYPDSEFTTQAEENIEELYWQQKIDQNSTSAYEEYLQKYPAGKYAKDAEARIEDMVWNGSSSIQDYEAYLQKYPAGKYAKDAEARIEDMVWNGSISIQDYEAYLQKYPGGKYVKEGKTKLEDMIWADSKKSNKIASYESYLDKYAQGRYAGEAKERIEELFWGQTESDDTVTIYKRYIQKYPEGKFIQQANKYIKLASEYNKAVNSVNLLRIFLKKYPETNFSQKASIRIEELIIDQINKNGIGNRFVIKDILPEDKGHKGGITIMSQAGNAYMISPNYYNDGIVFSAGNVFDSLFGGGRNMKMEPSQPLESGSIWRFVGKDISFANCVFSGEGKIESPLSFILIENKGFVHFRGSGSVRVKDGTVKKLKDD